ncbi:hypothetical protein DWB85_06220 [Seongchinamella sediminis]|uniref:Uncharacterized protein n=1 Tax=Seongchinamella sediminis TaxID=2283635 RepID=A0A3L7DYA1_9GAMM|nr:hypothetical protein [Seongchinamella sediminis]RLQ22578.1 hypothetical protein DWB85_06220 [Seongchinamella sediminis]
MKKLDISRIEDRFPTIYITLISVLLAVGLEDVISQVRTVESNELFNWIIAIYVGGTTLAAWTGYSFIAITQVRRPRLFDSVNVFALAIGIFIINSTVGESHHWFFFATALYMFLAAYAVFYNINMLSEVMPFDMQFRDWAPCLWGTLLYSPPAALAGWLSYKDILGETAEILLALVVMTQPPLWTMSFYKMWKAAMNRAQNAR